MINPAPPTRRRQVALALPQRPVTALRLAPQSAQFRLENVQAHFDLCARCRFSPRLFLHRRACHCFSLRALLRCCCLPHYRRIVAERRAALVVAHHVIPFHPQPQIGDHQIRPPRCVRRASPIDPSVQPVVQQPHPPRPAPPDAVHNHVLRHPRPRIVRHLPLQVVHPRLRRRDLDDQRQARPSTATSNVLQSCRAAMPGMTITSGPCGRRSGMSHAMRTSLSTSAAPEASSRARSTAVRYIRIDFVAVAVHG
jgi:hypothetical protein